MIKKFFKKATALVTALSIVIGGASATSVNAGEVVETKEDIVVWVGIDSLGTKNASGEAISYEKTPIIIEDGSNAADAFVEALDDSGIHYTATPSSYGLYFEEIGGLGYNEKTYEFWNFTYNDTYSNIGASSYSLNDGDQINFIYTTYGSGNNSVPSFKDDKSLNPTKGAISALVEDGKKAEKIIMDTIAKNLNGDYIPGIEDTYSLYTLFAMVRAGYCDEEYLASVYKKISKQLQEIKKFGGTKVVTNDYDYETGEYVENEKILTTDTISSVEYAKLILFLTAIGKDASNVCGMNLIDYMTDREIYNNSVSVWSKYGVEGMMLLALDSADYDESTKEGAVTRDELVNALVSDVDNQIEISCNPEYMSPDGAAMAVQAIAPYADLDMLDNDAISASRTAVEAKARKVINFLENYQNVYDGGFDAYGGSNPWSLAQVMITLGAYKVGLAEDDDNYDFIKNGKTLIDAALQFVDLEKKTVDSQLLSFGTEQLMSGLDSVIRITEGDLAYFEVTDVDNFGSDYSGELDDPYAPEVTATPVATASATTAPATEAPTDAPVTETPDNTKAPADETEAPKAPVEPIVIEYATQAPVATAAPAKASTAAAATASATTAASVNKFNTKKIKLAKKKASLKPGKSIKVKYKVTRIDETLAFDKVTAKIKGKNKKFAKIKLNTKKKNVKITLLKKAKKLKKGTKIKIVLTSGDKKAKFKLKKK
ncbi:MAG: DUF4430 domain-containing protein [Lachnospiraceae bacterium]|nr:DUF4430 domain-containing protein [Lachnospiraceae bacterium]